jgi:hypothetical protein
MRLDIEMKNDKSQFGSKNLYKRITDQFSCFGRILLQRGFFDRQDKREFNANLGNMS